MDIRAMAIEGALEITPRQFPDDRGLFLESFRADHLAAALGHRMEVRQTNVSVSARGVLRGIHYADVPPSQAKYVTALSGAFLDFVVDLRVGSPTFGRWDSALLDTTDRKAIYLAEGLGHALFALENDSTAMYLCSAPFAPTSEHGIHPLDPDVALALPSGCRALLSPKDAAAPTLAQARDRGLLPQYAECARLYEALAARQAVGAGT
jgi:dTDP-4-dehydrorhamnose 3,5-epimerase